MGCGISKSELEERGQGYHIRSLRRRNTEEKEDDSNSFTSRQRKSVSSLASEGGFLRRVLGSLEKERGTERDVILDSNDNVGLKSISSSSPGMDYNNNNNNNAFSLIKQPHVETMDKETTKESMVINNKEMEKQESIDDKEGMIIRARPSNVEASILFGPGSPSFRGRDQIDKGNPKGIGYTADGKKRTEGKRNKECNAHGWISTWT
ncbi:conserved hypothetical protein [Ricinus communis]|uniref:Uncharacterized protein n=1 Tax=Ricinus communis TaxID=3988 RepID=B9RH24_RICCO|nr:conserved hypothetical protein [Ricinus communis]